MINKEENKTGAAGCPLTQIHYLESDQAWKTRALWHHCFPEDSKVFIDYYYREIGQYNRILVGEHDGEIVSMLHRNPSDMIIKGRKICSDYIVAVGTLKEYRGLGCMREVLTKALNDMCKEGMPFTYLMPAAEAIYYPYDFRFAGSVQKAKMCTEVQSRVKMLPVKSSQEDLSMAAELMNQWLEKYDVHTLRDQAYVSRLLKELASEDGQMYFLEDNGKIIGLFAQWGLEKKEQRLLYIPLKDCDNVKMVPEIMVRITNIRTLLPIFGVCEKNTENPYKLLLHVYDPWIPENNGCFLWTIMSGKSEVVKVGQAEQSRLHAAQLSQNQGELHVSIADLTLWLFGQKKAKSLWKGYPRYIYDVLDRIDTIHRVYIDEVV